MNLMLAFGSDHRRILPVTAWILAAGVSAASAGSVLYVDDDAPPGGDGQTWDTAYRFLQDGLAAAQPGSGVEEIRVGQGLYLPDRDEANPDGSGDRYATFSLIESVALRGGYAGFGAADPDARDIALYETILSGDLLGDDEPEFVNNDENSLHVVSGEELDETTTFDGFILTAGSADGQDWYDRYGGGMWLWSSTQAIVDCTFRANYAEWGGGGAWLNASPSLVRCQFVGNHTDGTGGGLESGGHWIELHDCQFSGNTALRGGGMANLATPDLFNCTFTDNCAEQGGGIYNASDSYSEPPRFVDCVFHDNEAVSGGGVYCSDGSGDFEECTLNSNVATGEGGGAYVATRANVRFLNCQFSNNSAHLGGGACCEPSYSEFHGSTFSANDAMYGSGMYCTDEIQDDSYPPVDHPVTINECVFSENPALLGGGMYIDGADPVITACRFEGNAAELFGGGLCNYAGEPTLTACVFNENLTPVDGGGIYNLGNLTLAACAFGANTADAGGGIHYAGGLSLLTDCHFDSNTAVTGGGMYCLTSEPVLEDCTFTGNYAERGGGLFNDVASPSLTGCAFDENSAAFGAALCSEGGILTAANCEVNNNSADYRGGGSYITDGIADFRHCEFAANQSYRGAAFSTEGGCTTVSDCTFTDNYGEFEGAVSCMYSDISVSRCTFRGNVCDRDGGAIHADWDADPTVTDCDFIDNTAPSGGAICIGGISDPTIIRCRFSGNSAGGGGAIRFDYGGLSTLSDCHFADNSATSGGAIYSDGRVTLTGCTFIGNYAGGNGGALLLNAAYSTLNECFFLSNRADLDGGAIWNLRTYFYATNCILVSNTAGEVGGALYTEGASGYQGELAMTNCTIAGNTASSGGGGLAHQTDADSILANCVLWDNEPEQIYMYSDAELTVHYSDIHGGWEGTGEGNIDADPLFADPDDSDYHILPGSPCIDAADNFAVPDDVTTDLDGNPRFVDDPDTEDTGLGDPPIVDMGAYEYQGPLCPADVNDDEFVDIDDLFAVLAAWGVCDDCPEDINDDGLVDIDDLFAVLAAWGPCP